jgi:hypothetical protein
MVSTLLNALFVVSLAGFGIDAVIHIAALAGNPVVFQRFGKYMFATLFLVWIATIFFMNRLTREVKQKDLWKAALRGCPKWMRITAWVISGYAWVGMFANNLRSGDSNLAGARAGSGVMLAFFVIGVCVLYSAKHVELVDNSRRCLNGHRVGPLATFCEDCGSPVVENATPGRPSQ